VIENNIAAYGGGVYNNGRVEFHKVVLRGNQAVDTSEVFCCPDGGGLSHDGGAIYSEGPMTLSDTQVTSNAASASGGGLANRAVAELYRSTIAGNRAGADGGGMSTSYWLRMSETTVRDNEAGGLGGGVANNDLGGFTSAILVVESSTVSGNTSHDRGGGIANGTLESSYELRQIQLWMTNSTVSGNTADGHGGGIYTGLGEFHRVLLDNVTITANVADADGDDDGDGGGLFNRLGEVQFRNSILAENEDRSPSTRRPDCWTPRRFDSRGHNLIGVAATCPLDGILFGNLLGVDPRLGPLQDNGGRTQTHALLADSPAIDAGNPSGCMSDISRYLTVDQRGAMRTVDGNSDEQPVCDMGAFEFAAMQPIYRYLPLLRVP
jgi:predicted outer membrane repeat protein